MEYWPPFQRDRAASFAKGQVGPTACCVRSNKKGQEVSIPTNPASRRCFPGTDFHP